MPDRSDKGPKLIDRCDLKIPGATARGRFAVVDDVAFREGVPAGVPFLVLLQDAPVVVGPPGDRVSDVGVRQALQLAEHLVGLLIDPFESGEQAADDVAGPAYAQDPLRGASGLERVVNARRGIVEERAFLAEFAAARPGWGVFLPIVAQAVILLEDVLHAVRGVLHLRRENVVAVDQEDVEISRSVFRHQPLHSSSCHS